MTILDLFRLDGQTALVTGAAQGIGYEIARGLREAGANVVIADMNPEVGETAASALGGRFERLNVTDPSAVRDLAARLNGVSILVNNAGIVRNTPAEDTPDEDWRAVTGVNLDGVFWCCREFGRKMLDAGTGSIVSTASMSGLISNHPQPQAAYNASKAAVIGLTKSVAADYVARGIRCNCICPGTVDTPSLHDRINAQPDPVQARKDFIARQPMGRLAQAHEIAPIVLFLASDESQFATGNAYMVDGGMTI